MKKREKRREIRRGRLRSRLAAQFLAGTLGLSALLAGLGYYFIRSSYIRFYADGAQDVCSALAALIDGDRIGVYLKTGEKDDYYRELQSALEAVREEIGAAYLYVFAPQEDCFYYILDAGAQDGEKGGVCQLGDVYQYGETEYRYLVPDVKAKRVSGQVVLGADVGYGRSVSAWAPILDSQGELQAMIEADYHLEEVDQAAARFFILFLAGMLSGMALILTGLMELVKRRIICPVEQITDIFTSYREGCICAPEKTLRSRDEIELLYEKFVEMIERINRYVRDIRSVTAEKERIGAELSIARQIQADMLPSLFPAFPDCAEIDIYALMHPAREVGGDFYDFFLTDRTHLAFLIADVSGKGVPAALFMVIAKTLLKNRAAMGGKPNEIFESVNRQLCEGNQEGFFVTAWMGALDLETGILEYANAGHNPPLLLRKDGGAEWILSVPDFVLAGFADMRYKGGRLRLEAGDRLFLYTDGVTEAMDADELLYGEARLLRTLAGCGGMSVQESIASVLESIKGFSQEQEQSDDITMLEVEYLPRQREL